MSKKKKIILGIILLIIIMLVALFAGGLYYYGDNEKGEKDEGKVVIEEDPEQFNPNEYVKQFDGKQYKITDASGKIDGRVKIVIDESEEYMKVKVGYFIKINDGFEKTSFLDMGSDYNLYGNLQKADQTRNGNGTGSIGVALCAKDFWPDMDEMILGDSYSQTKKYVDCTWGNIDMLGADTDVFYHQLTRYSQPKDFSLDFVTDLSKLEIYDTSSSYYEDALEDGTSYYNYDAETVTQNGALLGTYNLIYN